MINNFNYNVISITMLMQLSCSQIDQDLVGACNDASSYCGIRDRRYPDRRAMGYPFDRVGRQGVNSLSDFLTANMATRECSIRFTDATRLRGQPRQ